MEWVFQVPEDIDFVWWSNKIQFMGVDAVSDVCRAHVELLNLLRLNIICDCSMLTFSR